MLTLGCGSMSAGSIRDGGGIRVESAEAYLHAPRGFPAPVQEQERLGREMLRCYEAELGDHLQYSDPSLMMSLQTDGRGGLIIRALQGQFTARGGFTNCVWATTTLFDWEQFERDAIEDVLPFEFGRRPVLPTR